LFKTVHLMNGARDVRFTFYTTSNGREKISERIRIDSARISGRCKATEIFLGFIVYSVFGILGRIKNRLPFPDVRQNIVI
jgi:hypothetical protein